MKLFGKSIGDGYPVIILAEAGINHGGSIEKAMRMVEVAKAAGADAVKFQKRRIPTLYRSDVLIEPSKASHSLGVYIPILNQCELSEIDHEKLKKYCDQIGIKYLCSPWDIPSVDFLEKLDVEAYKIPSACLSDIYLMDKVAETGKPVIVSTGMHNEMEINQLMKRYLEIFKDRIAMLHCVSSYPTANRDVNLKYIPILKRLYGIPTGFSGHERGLPITVTSVALGANIIERHFTLDRTLKGPDHAASLEPHGLEMLVRHIRAVEEAMGDHKKVNQGEIMARETLGKILTWADNQKPGARITKEMFSSTSPGYGVPVQKIMEILSEPEAFYVAHEVRRGQPFMFNHIKKGEKQT